MRSVVEYVGVRPSGLLSITMANNLPIILETDALPHDADDFSEPFAKRSRYASRLADVVVFLVPCRGMSALRRKLLYPNIIQKGGVVTTNPSEATHCVLAMPFSQDDPAFLLKKYGLPPSCEIVSESFLLR